MKEVTTKEVKINPYQYNGKSLHISPHTDSSESVKIEGVTNNKKVYIESCVCPQLPSNQLLN